VKFLVDVQFPLRAAKQLEAAGHDAVHTSQLPHGTRTTDAALAAGADAEDRMGSRRTAISEIVTCFAAHLDGS
jgi:predicted nuclease of predicted toxin-antitoxin system